MRVRTKGTEIVVDLVHEIVDIGELSKLGAVLGYNVVVEPGNSYDEEDPKTLLVRLKRRQPVFGETELADLAAVLCVAQGWTGQHVVDRLSHLLADMHLPMDRPISDVMGIGQGPDHPGHVHDEDDD